jgi:teichuronic acid biosynthesis glycosyltransferase TuaC
MSTDLRVLVVTSGWPSPAEPHQSVFVHHEVEALRGEGVEIDVVHYRGRMNPINYLKARAEVRRRLGAESYDLVHAHFGQTLPVVLPSSVPVVVTFRGSDLFGVVKRSGRYGVKGTVLGWISRALAKRVDAVVVPSRVLQEKLPGGVGSVVIPDAVDKRLFRPAPKDQARRNLGLPVERKLVLFGGLRSVPVKRYELARAAVDLVGEPGAELVAVDSVSRAEMAAYMAACDVLLVTSLHESGPLVVKEALACDRPVVSVDVGDVREWIGSLPGCVVCPDDDPKTIASALEGVLNSEVPFAWSDRIASLDAADMAKQTIDVYKSVLDGHRLKM